MKTVILAQATLTPVTDGILSVRDSVLLGSALVIVSALALFGVYWGGKYLVDLFASFADEDERATSAYLRERAEEERIEREVDLENNMNGMAPGWGRFHRQSGSGLYRGRR